MRAYVYSYVSYWLGWGLATVETVICPQASQVFLSKWRHNDRHIPSRFHLGNHAINQHSAIHYFRVTEMQGERVWVKDIETQKRQFCWSANKTPLRKVIKDSDSFFGREFYIGDIELWEMGDQFRFSPPCCSCLRGPRGVNQWFTHFSRPTTGHSLAQWGNKLQMNLFKAVSKINFGGLLWETLFVLKQYLKKLTLPGQQVLSCIYAKIGHFLFLLPSFFTFL